MLSDYKSRTKLRVDEMLRILSSVLVLCLFSYDRSVGHAQESTQPLQKDSASETLKRALQILESGPPPLAPPKESIIDIYGDDIRQLVKSSADDDRLKALEKERCQESMQAAAVVQQRYLTGGGEIETVFSASKRMVKALLALASDSSSRIMVLNHNLEFAKRMEQLTKRKMDSGAGRLDVYYLAKFERLNAEILLEKSKD